MFVTTMLTRLTSRRRARSAPCTASGVGARAEGLDACGRAAKAGPLASAQASEATTVVWLSAATAWLDRLCIGVLDGAGVEQAPRSALAHGIVRRSYVRV